MHPTTGIILAGGRSRRLGTDKALLPFGRQTLVERIAGVLNQTCGEVLVSVDRPDRPLPPDLLAQAVPDVHPGMGPLAGLYAGLRAARHDRCLLAACDMPFIQPALVLRLIDLTDDTADALVPRIEDRPQPLLAVYRKTCLPMLKDTLEGHDLKVEGFLDKIRVRFVRDEELRDPDPGLVSFFNLNRPEDLERAKELGL